MKIRHPELANLAQTCLFHEGGSRRKAAVVAEQLAKLADVDDAASYVVAEDGDLRISPSLLGQLMLASSGDRATIGRREFPPVSSLTAAASVDQAFVDVLAAGVRLGAAAALAAAQSEVSYQGTVSTWASDLAQGLDRLALPAATGEMLAIATAIGENHRSRG